MKKADIVPGGIYAYKEYTHSSLVSAVMVLDTQRLYRNDGTYYVPRWVSSDATRPRAHGRGYRTGYLVAMAVTGADLAGASLEEALNAPLASQDSPRTYSYGLQYQFTKLIGPYDTVVKELEEAAQRRAAAIQEQHARNLATAERFQAAVNALWVHGGVEYRVEDTAGLRWEAFEFDRERAKERPPCKFVLTIEDMESLISYTKRLEGKQ